MEAEVTLLLLEGMLLAMLDTTEALPPKGAGSPLAGDCRICTGGRTALGRLVDTDDEEVLLLVALDVGGWLRFSAVEPGAALIGFFWLCWTAIEGMLLEPTTVLSASSFAKVLPADEVFMVFFNDCIMCA